MFTFKHTPFSWKKLFRHQHIKGILLTYGVWHASTNEYIHWLWWQPCKLYLSTWTVYQSICACTGTHLLDFFWQTHHAITIQYVKSRECVSNHSLPLVSIQIQGKTLKCARPSKQVQLASRAAHYCITVPESTPPAGIGTLSPKEGSGRGPPKRGKRTL